MSPHIERIDEELDDKKSRMCGPFYLSGTSFGDKKRISTVIGRQKVLGKFVQCVMKAKRASIKTSTVFNEEGATRFGSPRLEWRWRDIRSRPMETIDLKHGMKNEMVQGFGTFVSPNRAEWCIGQGIPYYRGHLSSGPRGTGKLSTAFALAYETNVCIRSV